MRGFAGFDGPSERSDGRWKTDCTERGPLRHLLQRKNQYGGRGGDQRTGSDGKRWNADSKNLSDHSKRYSEYPTRESKFLILSTVQDPPRPGLRSSNNCNWPFWEKPPHRE